LYPTFFLKPPFTHFYTLCINTQIEQLTKELKKMAYKTISLSTEAYRGLSREKLNGESFSGAVMRLVAARGELMSYAGAWNDLPESEITRMKSGIAEMRRSATDRLVK
jgi:predicted CopG family antitoxin